MLRDVRWQYLYGDTVLRTHTALIDLFSVHPKQRSPSLLVEKLVTGLTQ